MLSQLCFNMDILRVYMKRFMETGLGERYPLLEIAILSAPQEQALGLLDSGRADLCVAFAGLQVDPQRGFQLMGVESLVATLAPHHPAARPGAIQNLEDLTAVRQASTWQY